jgi:7-cyano-7-deazaguanine synthase in queuosine biosynthesis
MFRLLVGVSQHQYEARCACVMTWRVYSDGNDEDPCGTCLNCGQTTYDLTTSANRAQPAPVQRKHSIGD